MVTQPTDKELRIKFQRGGLLTWKRVSQLRKGAFVWVSRESHSRSAWLFQDEGPAVVTEIGYEFVYVDGSTRARITLRTSEPHVSISATMSLTALTEPAIVSTASIHIRLYEAIEKTKESNEQE